MAGEGGLTIRGASLEVRGLTKSFGGTRVVRDVSFKVGGGTLLTLLGPSGSGKTTTLRMIAGFEEPDAGQVLVADEDITERPAHRRNIGVVFQQYALFPHLTVFDNVAYPLEMRRYGRAEIRSRVAAALDLVRLQGFEARYPRQLSGGQQQRVALARAIVFEPPVLLMDEPLGALDKRLRETMQVEVRRLQQQLGITTVSVTHDQVEALVMSDLIAVMDGGVLHQLASPLEIYQRPATRFVADFIGESNMLVGTRSDAAAGPATFTTAKGLRILIDGGGRDGAAATRPPADQPVRLIVRPEHVRIGPEAERAANRYAAEVLEVLYVGDLVKYRVVVETGDELWAKTLAPSTGQRWERGERVTVGWEPGDSLTVGT
ncbi:MAG TPA: ABC transporter ATP-binding protein [Methylomirabilota bacterium]|nr:ABC transporter ATP-binding protein [Methylomirabilota bacterium]